MPRVINTWMDIPISMHAYISYIKRGLRNQWLVNRTIDANTPLRSARRIRRKNGTICRNT